MADETFELKKLRNDKLLQIISAHRDAQFKYTYYFLTAAGAAIAFAINQTQAAVLSWSKLPLAVAVSCWGVSFVFGAYHLLELRSLLTKNIEFLKTEGDEAFQLLPNPVLFDMLSTDLKMRSKHMATSAHWQEGLLAAGFIAYVLWHILEMYLRLPR
jgi:hypothetical protein